MSASVLRIPVAGVELRVMIRGHRVDPSHVVVDVREGEHERWSALLPSEYRHKLERFDDERSDDRCYCCARQLAAAVHDQTIPGSEIGSGAMPESYLSDLRSAFTELITEFERSLAQSRRRNSWLYQQVVELRAEVQRMGSAQNVS